MPDQRASSFLKFKKINIMILGLIIGVVIGAILDNRYAPKVKVTDGKVTFEWSDKNKKQTP